MLRYGSGRTKSADGRNGRTDDAKTISLRRRRGIKSVARWNDLPDMTIAIDWDVKQQTKPNTHTQRSDHIFSAHWKRWTQTKLQTGFFSLIKKMYRLSVEMLNIVILIIQTWFTLVYFHTSIWIYHWFWGVQLLLRPLADVPSQCKEGPPLGTGSVLLIVLHYAAMKNWSGPEVKKHFSCWTQLSMKFILLINVKMPTIVGILTFISMIKSTSESLKAWSLNI